jgi:hypothetical protein
MQVIFYARKAHEMQLAPQNHSRDYAEPLARIPAIAQRTPVAWPDLFIIATIATTPSDE